MPRQVPLLPGKVLRHGMWQTEVTSCLIPTHTHPLTPLLPHIHLLVPGKEEVMGTPLYAGNLYAGHLFMPQRLGWRAKLGTGVGEGWVRLQEPWAPLLWTMGEGAAGANHPHACSLLQCRVRAHQSLADRASPGQTHSQLREAVQLVLHSYLLRNEVLVTVLVVTLGCTQHSACHTLCLRCGKLVPSPIHLSSALPASQRSSAHAKSHCHAMPLPGKRLGSLPPPQARAVQDSPGGPWGQSQRGQATCRTVQHRSSLLPALPNCSSPQQTQA